MIALRIAHSAGNFAETFNIDRNTGNVVVEFGSSRKPAASASERGTCHRHTGRAF
jgi:hypothetical protein